MFAKRVKLKIRKSNCNARYAAQPGWKESGREWKREVDCKEMPTLRLSLRAVAFEASHKSKIVK